jgi:hypothetical protein
MPTPTYTPLATVTLGTTASSITLSNIPASYRDLIIVFEGSVSSGDNELGCRYNGDSGTNYSHVYAVGFPTTSTASVAQTNYTTARFGNITTTRSNQILQIMDYSATDKHKTMLIRTNNGSATSEVWMMVNRWANTAAINSILILPSASTLTTGTTVNLYGIKA